MKKTYQIPTIEIVKINVTLMQASSPGQQDLRTEDFVEDTEQIGSRLGYSVWDDEDDY